MSALCQELSSYYQHCYTDHSVQALNTATVVVSLVATFVVVVVVVVTTVAAFAGTVH